MRASRTGSNIEIQGVKQTLLALRAFTPDIEKRLDSQIKDALRATEVAARARYPRGSWVVNRNTKKLLGYIAARSGGGKSKKSWGNGPPGRRSAIFEFLGTRYSGNKPQVVNAIASLNARYGSPGRFLWAAWDATGADVLARIEQSVREAEKELQAHLDRAGVSY